MVKVVARAADQESVVGQIGEQAASADAVRALDDQRPALGEGLVEDHPRTHSLPGRPTSAV
jgi:hypothetical protein